MSTSLAVIDKELTLRLPTFQQVLPPGVSPQRLMRTVLTSIERNPDLLGCTPQSIMNAATTAAVLGLEVDGVTGQGYLIKYGNVCTFQVGYRGLNTLAARAGYSVSGEVVREGDEFEYELGSAAFVRHKPLLHDTNKRRIIAAWAAAESRGRPPLVVVMSIDEILQIKEKSPGARKPGSPWRDTEGPGFAAMCSKTAKRRLARSMPLSVMQRAAALDNELEQGRAAHLDVHGDLKVVGEGTAEGPVAGGVIVEQQPADILTPANPTPPAKKRWEIEWDTLTGLIGAAKSADELDAVLKAETSVTFIEWLMDKRPADHDKLYDEHIAPRRAIFSKGA